MLKYILYLLLMLIILLLIYLIIKKYTNTYEPYANLIETTKDNNDIFYSLKPPVDDCLTLELSDNLLNNATIVNQFGYKDYNELDNILKNNINVYDFYEISETGKTNKLNLYKLNNSQDLNLNSNDPSNSFCKRIDNDKKIKIKEKDIELKPQLNPSYVPKDQKEQKMKLVDIPRWPVDKGYIFHPRIQMSTNGNAISSWGFDLLYDYDSLELTNYKFEDKVKGLVALNDNRIKGIFNVISVNGYLAPQNNTTIMTLTFKVKSTAKNIFRITGTISNMALINGKNYFENEKHKGNALPFKHSDHRGSFNAYSEIKLKQTQNERIFNSVQNIFNYLKGRNINTKAETLINNGAEFLYYIKVKNGTQVTDNKYNFEIEKNKKVCFEIWMYSKQKCLFNQVILYFKNTNANAPFFTTRNGESKNVANGAVFSFQNNYCQIASLTYEGQSLNPDSDHVKLGELCYDIVNSGSQELYFVIMHHGVLAPGENINNPLRKWIDLGDPDGNCNLPNIILSRRTRSNRIMRRCYQDFVYEFNFIENQTVQSTNCNRINSNPNPPTRANMPTVNYASFSDYTRSLPETFKNKLTDNELLNIYAGNNLDLNAVTKIVKLKSPGITGYFTYDESGTKPVDTLRKDDYFYLQLYAHTGGKNLSSIEVKLVEDINVCKFVPVNCDIQTADFTGQIQALYNGDYSTETGNRHKIGTDNFVKYTLLNRVSLVNSDHVFIGYIKLQMVGAGKCFTSSTITTFYKDNGTAMIEGVNVDDPFTLYEDGNINLSNERPSEGFTNMFTNMFKNIIEGFQGNFNFRSDSNNINSNINNDINFAASGNTNSLSLIVDGTKLIENNKNTIPFNIYQSIPISSGTTSSGTTSSETTASGTIASVSKDIVPSTKFRQIPGFTPPTIPSFASTPGFALTSNFALNPGITPVPHVNSQDTINYIQQNPQQFLGNNITPAMAYYSCNNN